MVTALVIVYIFLALMEVGYITTETYSSNWQEWVVIIIYAIIAPIVVPLQLGAAVHNLIVK